MSKVTNLARAVQATTSRVTVNVLTNKAFTQEDVDTVTQIFNPLQQQLYPSYFGDEVPYGGKFLEFELIDINDIIDFEVDSIGDKQIGRAVSGNPKKDEIKNDIAENDYKLRCLPPQGQRMPDRKVRIVNGRTRKSILEEYGVQNIIMGMFKYPDDKAFISHTILANCEHDPAGNAGTKDVLFAGQKLISMGLLNGSDKDELREWVDTSTGSGIFTTQTIDKITWALYKNKDGRDYVSTWGPSKVIKWMNNQQFEKVTTNNSTLFKDTKVDDNYLYYVVSHSTAMKNVISVAEFINNNPGKHIRVVIHTGTLPADIAYKDLAKRFQARCDDHNTYFRNYLNSLKDAFYVSTPTDKSSIKISNNFTLYGAMPTLDNIHKSDEFVIF